MFRPRLMRAVLFVLTVMVTMQEVLLACPNCKEGFTGTTSQASGGEEYSWTIYLVMTVPGWLGGLVSYKNYTSMRNKEQVEAAV